MAAITSRPPNTIWLVKNQRDQYASARGNSTNGAVQIVKACILFAIWFILSGSRARGFRTENMLPSANQYREAIVITTTVSTTLPALNGIRAALHTIEIRRIWGSSSETTLRFLAISTSRNFTGHEK